MDAPQGYSVGPQGYAYDGPPGKVRPTGVSILLFVVTFGIYGYVYNYLVHDEMKKHSGRGVGGGIALLLTFLVGIAMPFVTSHEVGSLYERKSQTPPVKALTGLWSVIPAAVGMLAWVLGFVALIASSDPDSGTGELSPSDASVGALLVALAVGFLLSLAGAIVWFVKTNGALNRYWQAWITLRRDRHNP